MMAANGEVMINEIQLSLRLQLVLEDFQIIHCKKKPASIPLISIMMYDTPQTGQLTPTESILKTQNRLALRHGRHPHAALSLE
ncbi:hypothetical protein NQ315_005253 [Exocentrus adspersus]|uniref:Uncharacterized protein n=1 Tax=Exocentrus adspersus TaxID=1586481 RepID=A0AAV8W126_9CUCU|nr:hypothetical protein NQ315_005253 [Exocentrus adspersus]